MNTSSAVENKPTLSIKDALFKLVPESVVGRTLFWGALPALLLLLTLGVSFLKPSSFSIYLPFLALIGGVLCIRWKTVGLGGCYFALALLIFTFYKTVPGEERLWQMGSLCALALDFFILLLAVQEINSVITHLTDVARSKAKELYQSQLDLQKVTNEKEVLEQSLEEEIKRLKEEAEQRRIEKQQEDKRLELIMTEIDWLTSQKERLVAEAEEGRALFEKGSVSENALQEMRGKLALLQEELQDASSRLAREEEEKKHLLEQLQEAQAGDAQISALMDAHENLKRQKQELDTRLEELGRANKTLKTDLDAASANLQKTKEHLGMELEKKEGEAASLQADLLRLQEQLSQSERQTKTALLTAQEKLLALQVTPPVKVDTSELRKMEGMYKQLRYQFEEKSRILSQTRSELFQSQCQVLAHQNETYLKDLDPDREEILCYEEALNQMGEEVERLEEEVVILEELVSRSHSR